MGIGQIACLSYAPKKPITFGDYHERQSDYC
jgi:hypothetical protein